MNLQQYQEASTRTMAFKGVPQNPMEYANGMQHYTFGVLGETVELMKSLDDREAALLEMGDILHYTTGLLSFNNQQFDEKWRNSYMPQTTVTGSIDKILFYAGDISEEVKKHFYCGHPFKVEKVIACAQLIVLTLETIASQLDSTLPEVMRLNLEKIKARYEKGFTPKESIERVDVNG